MNLKNTKKTLNFRGIGLCSRLQLLFLGLSDLELIRKQLGIDKWVIFGESWGSALGLVYAEKFPQHVLSLILRGILLASQEDIDWFYNPNGVSRIFPEAWEAFTNHLSEVERKAGAEFK